MFRVGQRCQTSQRKVCKGVESRIGMHRIFVLPVRCFRKYH